MARSRFLRGLGVGVLLTLGLLTLVSSYVWSLALSEECDRLERVDLSLEQMVDLKKKVDASRRAGSNEVVLSGPETSFVLREFVHLPVFVQVEGGQVGVKAAVPRDDQCYNIDFRGELAIEGALATVRPSHLMVGELDLSWWLGEEVQVTPTDWVDAETVEMLAHLQRVQIDGDTVRIQLDDLAGLR